MKKVKFSLFLAAIGCCALGLAGCKVKGVDSKDYVNVLFPTIDGIVFVTDDLNGNGAIEKGSELQFTIDLTQWSGPKNSDLNLLVNGNEIECNDSGVYSLIASQDLTFSFADVTITFNEAEGVEYLSEYGATATVPFNSELSFKLDISPYYTADSAIVRAGTRVADPNSDGTYVIRANSDMEINVLDVVRMQSTCTSGGTSNEDPFMIYTPADWLFIAEQVNAGNVNYVNGYYQLEADLDFKGETIPVIGDATEVSEGVNTYFGGYFNGMGHTISNFKIQESDMPFVGLFGYVVDATIENLTIEGLVAEVEGGTLAAVAGRADGKCVFKNITVKNCKLGTYNNRCGAIVGWTGYYKNEADETVCDFTFEDINICDDVVLGGLWGSFDSSIGGVMGQLNSGATNCLLKNVTVSCRIDAYNDCTASYDYYLYRMCGMLIGQMTKTTQIDGSTYPDVAAYGIEFENVTVNYGQWMNYHYCEPTPGLNGGRGMRVEAGFTYDGLPSDFDHTQCVDNHYNCIPFDQLFGGTQTACKGVKAWDGVTVNYPAKYTCSLCGNEHGE